MEIKNNAQETSMVIRVLAGIAWLVLIYVVTSFLVGAIVGGIAGAEAGNAGNLEGAQAAGAQAAMEFQEKYGLLVLFGQLALFSLLAFTGLLPGTTKFKKSEK